MLKSGKTSVNKSKLTLLRETRYGNRLFDLLNYMILDNQLSFLAVLTTKCLVTIETSVFFFSTPKT